MNCKNVILLGKDEKGSLIACREFTATDVDGILNINYGILESEEIPEITTICYTSGKVNLTVQTNNEKDVYDIKRGTLYLLHDKLIVIPEGAKVTLEKATGTLTVIEKDTIHYAGVLNCSDVDMYSMSANSIYDVIFKELVEKYGVTGEGSDPWYSSIDKLSIVEYVNALLKEAVDSTTIFDTGIEVIDKKNLLNFATAGRDYDDEFFDSDLQEIKEEDYEDTDGEPTESCSIDELF